MVLDAIVGGEPRHEASNPCPIMTNAITENEARGLRSLIDKTRLDSALAYMKNRGSNCTGERINDALAPYDLDVCGQSLDITEDMLVSHTGVMLGYANDALVFWDYGVSVPCGSSSPKAVFVSARRIVVPE